MACVAYCLSNQAMVSLSHGDIAQLGERGVRNAEVGGSSPPISTTNALTTLNKCLFWESFPEIARQVLDPKI